MSEATAKRLAEIRVQAAALTYPPTRQAAFELLGEIDRLRACAHALSDIYRKTDGTMRTCNRNAAIICNERLCHVNGCARANDILKVTKETGDV
jgi:hypothetical protein